MPRYRTAAVVSAGLIASAGLIGLGACSTGPSAPTVPHLPGGAGQGPGVSTSDNPNAVGGDSSAERRAKLHAAAQCIREHGAAQYQDPLLTADGYVYTDAIALRGVAETQLNAIDQACGTLITAAHFAMQDQGPPPPKVIAAGVKSAGCLRSHGLPDAKDPTVNSRFTPGKGFALDPATLPAAGKADPAVRRALDACRTLLDEEASLSSLGDLGNA